MPKNQSGSRNYPPNRQVTTDSSPSVGRGRVIAATSQQGQSSQQNRPMTQARVFTMTQEEALASPKVLTIMLTIFD